MQYPKSTVRYETIDRSSLFHIWLLIKMQRGSEFFKLNLGALKASKNQIWIPKSKFPFSDIKSELLLFIIAVVSLVALLCLSTLTRCLLVAFTKSQWTQICDWWIGAIPMITLLKLKTIRPQKNFDSSKTMLLPSRFGTSAMNRHRSCSCIDFRTHFAFQF